MGFIVSLQFLVLYSTVYVPGTVYSSLVALPLAMAWDASLYYSAGYVFLYDSTSCLELYGMLPAKFQVPHKKFVSAV